MTGHALQEEEPGLLVEDGVGAAASVTRHILFNIPENNHFYQLFIQSGKVFLSEA